MNRPAPLSHELVLFRDQFRAIQGNDPFPWQERLFREFCCGTLPPALDLPTGLGKTCLWSWLCENALEEFRQTAIWANWVASRRKD
jgi:hypothetical protein